MACRFRVSETSCLILRGQAECTWRSGRVQASGQTRVLYNGLAMDLDLLHFATLSPRPVQPIQPMNV